MTGMPPMDDIEQQIVDAYGQLDESVAAARYRHDHYASGRAAVDGLSAAVTGLMSAYPWALCRFGDSAWDGYCPDLQAPIPDGLRVGVMVRGGAEGLPQVPAVARFFGSGHLLIRESKFPGVARSLLQALVLRLIVATTPGTVRLALADLAGQGQYLSPFLRLPAPQMRLGNGVATTQAELEGVLRALTEHVAEVEKNRWSDDFGSIAPYNGERSGLTGPYHVLVVTGFPIGVTGRVAKLLTKLAHNGPRAGVYIIATVNQRTMPSGLDLASLTRLATNLKPESKGLLTWDDTEYRETVIEPDQMPTASRANPLLDAVAAAAKAVPLHSPVGSSAVSRDSRRRSASVAAARKPRDPAPAGHVFISYAHEDSPHADRLQRKIEAFGVPVWRDTFSLWPGEDWRRLIRGAIISDSLVFLACFSRASVDRRKSFQNEEIKLAIEELRQRRPEDTWLIPVRLDECEIPDLEIGGGRTLSSIQQIDLFGQRADENMDKLLAGILRVLRGH